MRFNYFVIAALATAFTHALSIYNIVAQVPSLGTSDINNLNEVEPRPNVTQLDPFCSTRMTAASRPTAEDFKKCMRSKAKVEGKSLFYSGAGLVDGPYDKEADDWKYKYHRANFVHLMTLDDFWRDKNVKAWAYRQARVFGRDNQRKYFWGPASQAMAELSNGDVLILMPKKADPTKKKNAAKRIIWYDIECPTLAKNEDVERVYQVHPESIDDKKAVKWKGCLERE